MQLARLILMSVLTQFVLGRAGGTPSIAQRRDAFGIATV